MSENNIHNEDELWAQLSSDKPIEPKAEKPKAEPKASKPVPEKTPRKIDGFFVACMAGVAAVSVALTLLVTGMGGTKSPAPAVDTPNATESAIVAELERENATLRAQLEQQKEQVKDLQNDLLNLMGQEDYLSSTVGDTVTDQTGETAETGENADTHDIRDAQLAALETFAQIQEAYADFDRARLEELIPQMDTQLAYLSSEALNNYYLILEYVEQPSNG